MHKIIALVSLLLASCASVDNTRSGADASARFIYSSFSMVVSHGRDPKPWDVQGLERLHPWEGRLDADRMDALIARLHEGLIGKATRSELEQLQAPVLLVVFEPGRDSTPLLVSDGCYLVNRENDDLYVLEKDVASDFFGITDEAFDSRLCQWPHLGVRLSPRPAMPRE